MRDIARYSLLAAALAFAACAATATDAPTPGAELVLSKDTWAHFQKYRDTVDRRILSRFVVTKDGLSSFAVQCKGFADSEAAKCDSLSLDSCHRGAQKDCLILAVNGDIGMPYRVEQ